MKLAAQLALVALVVALSTSADARRKPEDIFRGQIIILKKSLPLKFKNVNDFVRALKKNRIDHVWPRTKKEKEWRIEYAAFFAKPLNDFQAEVKFYDITNKGRQPRFVNADSQYTRKRGERYLFNTIILEKSDDGFKPNRKYLMRLESKRKVIAKTTFTLRGRGPQYSGKVTFTDEETK